jgi:long-subunit acyl-CoA synthetase (AMP-forming)
VGARMRSDANTLIGHIDFWAKKRPNAGVLHARPKSGKGWDVTTWSDYRDDYRTLAKGMMALGVKPGEGVAIVGANRPEWVKCQMASFAAGGLLGPIYTTNTKEQTAYIVKDCGAKIAVCDDAEQLAKYRTAQEEGLIDVTKFVTMDEIDVDDDRVMSYAELMALGREQDDAGLEKRLAEMKQDDVAMLIYTSGTTGKPKGAMYTHANIDATSRATVEAYPDLRGDIRAISYLPLCHAAEQGMLNMAGLRLGGKAYFCGDIKQIKDYLTEVRPSFFLGVPRVWEKFEAALRGRFSEASGLQAKLLHWAMKTELAAFEESSRRGHPVEGLRRRLANRLVLGKIRTALGLDQLEYAFTGAAPISRSTLDFFASIGIPLHEGYGMTETTAFATAQPPKQPRFGTIGKALPGVEIRIADDGEIMLKGPNMIRGYHNLENESRELYTGEWMHTGDLGSLDDDGFLKITGRKKDLIITAGGKNVAPAEIEGLLQSIPGVGQAVVVGDRQPYLCALLVLDEEALPDLAQASGVSLSSTRDAAKSDDIREWFDQRINADCNGQLARYQTIKKFEILPEPFSVDGGELTPTMKVKRNVVNDKYANVIQRFYA